MKEYYDRQIKVFGNKAQDKLGGSKVLVLGCGALGNITANNLARAGASLRLVDRDVVEESNLHRTLFRKKDIYKPKVEVLKDILSESVDVNIETVFTDFNRFNYEEIIEGIDIVVDCMDSMRSRFLLNEISVKEGLPFVHGAVIRTEGRVKFFDSEKECLRCVYPKKPRPGSLETCSDSGVLNTATSLVSSLQVDIVLKYLTGFGKQNKDFFVFDLKNNSFRNLKVNKRKNCEVCVQKRFEMLENNKKLIIEKDCDGYHIIPKEADVDLEYLAKKYNTEPNDVFITFEFSENRVILFENGRMHVDSSTEREAKNIYTKIVGI